MEGDWLRYTARKDKLNLSSYTVVARGAGIPYSRVYGFFTGGRPQLTDDELHRLDSFFARLEAGRQLLGVA